MNKFGFPGLTGNSGFLVRCRARSGVALVLVLGFLVLITVLIVAYFTSVSTEANATKTYANGATTKFLADSAVNIVMGQIAKSTQGQSSAGERLTWASQPGMIRTFGTSPGPAGNYVEDCYKLYSSSQMVIPTGNSVQSAMAADVPTGWNTQPAIFTDLNAPVTDSGGNANFPILDGNKIKLVGKVLTYKTTVLGTTPDIEGFSIQQSYPPSFVSANPLSATNTPVPMPVQWLYVLKDGTIITPDPVPAGGNGTVATFQNASSLINNGSNPITGRIAFWTDDETCKLNINTASEGTYFASPHTDSPMDMQSTTKTSGTATYGFGVSPPATGEYNRYPGHPATTCLSVALGYWLNVAGGATAPNAYTSTANDNSYLSGLANYLNILPRSGTGGSCAGTILAVYPNYGGPNASYTTVSSSANRLFASVDELTFSPSRNSNTYATSNPTVSGTFTRAELEELKFFLTASSRAPELTPFDTPKVSLWPQFATASDRLNNSQGFFGTLATQQLLAFCSSFGTATSGTTSSGKNEYFMQICSPSSFGSSTLDWQNVARNQQLATYLCNLGNTNIPGYGAAFRSATKYSDRSFSNIVVDCLDYIRCCVANNWTGDAPAIVPPLYIADNVLPGVTGTSPIKGFGFSIVCPQIVLGMTLSGTGQYPFIAVDGFNPTKSIPGANNTTLYATFTNLGNLGLVQASGAAPPASVSVGADDLIHSDKPNPMRPFVFNFDINHTTPQTSLKFANTTTTVTASGTTNMVMMGGTNAVTISFLDNSGTAYQNIQVQFPPVTLPFPTQACPVNSGQQEAGWIFNNANWSIARGMECSVSGSTSGDYRLLGGLVNPPSGDFTPSVGYTGTNLQAHTLRIYCGSETQPIFYNNVEYPRTSSLAGSLVPYLSNTGYTDYEDHEAPFVPLGMLSATNSQGNPGDWDTGPSVYPDGPYLNPVEQVTAGALDGYFDWYWGNGSSTYIAAAFTPNRRIASAIKFGSIPTGVCAVPPQPWQTLLFCPNPAARTTPVGNSSTVGSSATKNDHLGFANPPDHLFLDFFTMPVVQPYAISEPLSTAGKVNLNYQMAPFTQIERSTALRGVLKNTLVAGISGYDVKAPNPAQQTSDYNSPMYKGDSTGAWTDQNIRYAYEMRYDVNRDATIAGIEEHYFNLGQIFRYPSEICDVFLVPQYLGGASSSNYTPNAAPPPTAYDNMLAWWNQTSSTSDPLSTMSLTGDNLREEPYDHLYPRLTTQSNTFTVHCRVQVLQKRSGSDPTVWQEGQDMVASEYRGSSLIERYIDPNDPRLTSNWDTATINVDFTPPANPAVDASADLSRLYKFRVISTKKFAP